MYKLTEELRFIYDSLSEKMCGISFVKRCKELYKEARVRGAVFRKVPVGLIEFRNWVEAKRLYKEYLPSLFCMLDYIVRLTFRTIFGEQAAQLYNWYLHKQAQEDEITKAVITAVVKARRGTVERRAVEAVLCSKYCREEVNDMLSSFEDLFCSEEDNGVQRSLEREFMDVAPRNGQQGATIETDDGAILARSGNHKQTVGNVCDELVNGDICKNPGSGVAEATDKLVVCNMDTDADRIRCNVECNGEEASTDCEIGEKNVTNNGPRLTDGTLEGPTGSDRGERCGNEHDIIDITQEGQDRTGNESDLNGERIVTERAVDVSRQELDDNADRLGSVTGQLKKNGETTEIEIG